MSTVSFLNNRQIGKSKYGPRNHYHSLNLDNVLSRLVCHKRDIFTVCGEEISVPPFACRFRRDAQSDLLAVANEDGLISLYDTTAYRDNALHSFTAHHNAVFDICWLPDKCQLVSGSGDHNAALWDMSSCKLISVFKKHCGTVKSVDVCREQSAIFATGSRDGSINVWDTREKNGNVYSKPAVNIFQAHCRTNNVYGGRKNVQKDPVRSISAVAFQDSNNLASAGVADGVVKVWDLRKTYVVSAKYLPSPRYRMNYSEPGTSGHGCTSLVFDSQYRNLYACSTNHKILKFNCSTYTKEDDVYEGFRCSTYFVKLAISNDDQYLLCGSSDDKAYIWKISKPGLPIRQLAAHSAEVTSVCWSPYNITKLVTCGDDNKVAIWKVAGTETVEVNEEIYAVAEPYSESSKNDSLFNSPPFQWNSPIPSNVSTKKSPVDNSNKLVQTSNRPSQTPNKPAVRAITSFFSPMPSLSRCSSTSGIDTDSRISDESPCSSNKLTVGSPTLDLSSQVLTPSNIVNADNICKSPEEGSGTLSSLELKSPENKNSVDSFLSSSLSVEDKENSSENASPETKTIFKTNSTGHTKRKVTIKHSTPNIKRKQTESSKKTKGVTKNVKKTIPGKTIMNYFSARLSPD